MRIESVPVMVSVWCMKNIQNHNNKTKPRSKFRITNVTFVVIILGKFILEDSTNKICMKVYQVYLVLIISKSLELSDCTI